MKISIIGRQMEVRDDLKALVEKKLAKLDKFFSDQAEATVRFSRLRESECLEITISDGGTIYRCEEKNTTFQNALDRCMDAIERQIRKNKTRLERRLRAGAFVPTPAEIPSMEVEEESDFKIRTKTFYFKPMTPEEAILQMNLLGHDFFVFKDSDSEETCVVYKRKDGDYGLIVPSTSM